MTELDVIGVVVACSVILAVLVLRYVYHLGYMKALKEAERVRVITPRERFATNAVFSSRDRIDPGPKPVGAHAVREPMVSFQSPAIASHFEMVKNYMGSCGLPNNNIDVLNYLAGNGYVRTNQNAVPFKTSDVVPNSPKRYTTVAESTPETKSDDNIVTMGVNSYI